MKKIFLLSLTFLLATFSGNSFAMGGKFAQKMGEFGRKAAPYAKKAFGATCAAMGFGISAGPFLYVAAYGLIDIATNSNHILISTAKLSKLTSLNPTNTEVTNFCKQELAEVGLDPQKVTIYSGNAASNHTDLDVLKDADALTKENAVTVKDTVVIVKGASELETLLQKKSALQHTPPFFDKVTDYFAPKIQSEKQKTENELNEWRFIMQHEGSHIKHKDTHRSVAAATVIPLVTHFALRRTPTTVLGHLGKIPGGLATLILNSALFSSYKKHIEQQADDAVSDNIAVLEGGKRVMTRLHGNSAQFINKHVISSIEKAENINPLTVEQIEKNKKIKDIIFQLMYYSMDPLHPTPLARAKKLEQRIANFKNKTQ